MKYKIGIILLATVFFIGSCAKEKNPLAPVRDERFISSADIMFSGNVDADASQSWGEFSFAFLDDVKENFVVYFYGRVSTEGFPDSMQNYTSITDTEIIIYNNSDKVFKIDNGSLTYTYSSAGKSGGDVTVNSLKINGYTTIQNIKYPDMEMELNYNNGVANLPVGDRYYSIYITDLYGNISIVNKKISPVIIKLDAVVPYTESLDIHNTTTWPSWYFSVGSMGEITSVIDGNNCKVKVESSIRDLMELGKSISENAFIVGGIIVSDGINQKYYYWNNYAYDDGGGSTFSVDGGPLIVTFK